MTSSGSAAGVWSRDDSATFSLAAGMNLGPGRRLYRSDSLPAGGSEESASVRARVAIPRIAMARFNADGTPKSILKKSSSVSSESLQAWTIHRVPEKTSHFNFRHNFAIWTDGEVMAKIKVACFFWDTVYISVTLLASSQATLLRFVVIGVRASGTGGRSPLNRAMSYTFRVMTLIFSGTSQQPKMIKQIFFVLRNSFRLARRSARSPRFLLKIIVWG